MMVRSRARSSGADFVGAQRRRLLLRGVEAFGEPGEPAGGSVRLEDQADKPPRCEVVLCFVAGATSLNRGRFSRVGAQLGTAQLHAQPVRLGPPQHRRGVTAALLVVGVELRGGVLLGGQPGDSRVGVGDDDGGIRFGGRHGPAVRGGFLVRNCQMQ